MSHLHRLFPVLLLTVMVLLFVGCPCPPPHRVEATYIGGGMYSLAIGDTSGGGGWTDTLYMAAIGDTPGGSGFTTTCVDCTGYCPKYMLLIGDTSGGGGSH